MTKSPPRLAVIDLEEALHEEVFGVISPCLRQGIPRVDGRPSDDGCVVDGDEETDADLEPADGLGKFADAAECQRGGSAEAVADSEVEPQ